MANLQYWHVQCVAQCNNGKGIFDVVSSHKGQSNFGNKLLFVVQIKGGAVGCCKDVFGNKVPVLSDGSWIFDFSPIPYYIVAKDAEALDSFLKILK